MNLIYITGIGSLIIQIITAILDFYVLNLNTPINLTLLKELLLVEFVVQIIEGAFYIWMIMNFSSIRNITPKRYFDWMITTPSMLLTYSLFLLYLKETSNIDSSKIKCDENENQNQNVACKGMKEVIIDNWWILLPILLLNWIMLLFGFLGEMNIIPIVIANILGFIPFFIYFGLIYYNFAKDFTLGKITFAVFFSLWGLYGVAAFLSYNTKNIIFNILDLFAKNFFGIFLAFLIVYKMKKQREIDVKEK
jgi:hypothetical protein